MEGTDGVKTTGADAVLQDIRAKAVLTIEREPDHDTELLAILTNHIVVALPDEDAVDHAAEAIRSLAETRTRP